LALLEERDIGEKTGHDYEREREIPKILDPIDDARTSVQLALRSPWEMVIVFGGNAFLLKAATYAENLQTLWKATVSDVDMHSLFWDSGPQATGEWSKTMDGHQSAQSAIREAAIAVIDEIIDNEGGPD
jgi:hypothetical protein